MKPKSAIVFLFYVATLHAIPTSAQDFLKRIKPWLFPSDSLEALDGKPQPPERRHAERSRSMNTQAQNALGLSQSFSDCVQPLWVSHYASGLIPVDDNAQAVAVDGSGNVYVTGSSEGSGTYSDYATVKYNASGVEQWVARYNGPGNSDDRAAALAVDATGNVYVTGFSEGSGTSQDYITVKYNASGIEQWVARYNGPGNSHDRAATVAVDATGNVYVTGASVGTGYDYATVKYNASGIVQWVARYNGPGNSDDLAAAVAVDAAGNVYVTGASVGSGTYSDYATVKYNASGIEQWVARYNKPGNYSDGATAPLAVDAAGNVYVTGYSEGSGTSSDYVTVKYNAPGIEQWVARYNGPGNNFDQAIALAVDAAENVYVTGYSKGPDTYDDYATIKYNASGIEQWVARYNGPENFHDRAAALAVDAIGNVYVTGYSPDLGTAADYATVKYNASGVEQWLARYNGPGNSDDQAAAVAVDATGNVYVTGYSEGSGILNDYATIKYNASGIEQWVARYNGPGNSHDQAAALAVDATGNVYVTGSGFSLAVGTYDDYTTVKYNASGIVQWVARYNGPGNSDDRAATVAVDATGNVYVTGFSGGSGTSHDYATVKYNASGIEQWVARYNRLENSEDQAAALAVDATGNVYVTGYSEGSSTFNDYATVKYSASGIEQWVARYNGPGNSDDQAAALAVDATGNVYVTGSSGGSGTDEDYATIKYNSSGIEQWAARYDGPGNNFDHANALAVDAAGNVYVTGYSYVVGTADYATIKYNASGIEQWVASYQGPDHSTDVARAFAVDAAGNVYVTGYSYAVGTAEDYATVKYNASGIEQWVARYNGPGNPSDHAIALAADTAGNVYVTGSSTWPDSRSVYTTIKYPRTLSPVATTNVVTNIDYTSATLNGTINPNNFSTTARFQYGTTLSYGNAVAATPEVVIGTDVMPVRADLSNLSSHTTYHYQLVATSCMGTARSMDQMFTTLNHSPARTDMIPQQHVTVARTSFTQDLLVMFTDPDGDTLSYSARSSRRSIATTEVLGSLLRVVPIASGEAIITVVANDGYGGADSLTFQVAVNSPPIIISAIRDTILARGGTSLLFDLSTSPFVFTDPDGDELIYSASSSNPNIVTASISGSLLTVAPVAVGEAIVTVEADDNKGGKTLLTFNVSVKEANLAPLITPVLLTSPQPLGQTITISVEITDNSGIADARLFFRQGGETNFAVVNLRGSAGLRQGTIPKKEVTSFGLEYYFEATDVDGQRARQPSDGVYPIRIDIPTPGITNTNAQPTGSDQTAYRLVSVPLELKEKSAHSVLEDDLGPYKNSEWRFYERRSDGGYNEYPATSIEITPGKGYWLIVKEPGKRISTGAGVTIRTDTVFTISVHPGWNFIGNPFNFAIPVQNLRLTSTGKSPTFRAYKGIWNTNPIEELQPFEGYAVANDSTFQDTLLINPEITDTTSALLVGQASSLQTKQTGSLRYEWSIRILAQCQQARDADNLAAIVAKASSTRDELDQPEPPVIGEYVSVYFPHREWSTLAKTYCIDARPEPTEGEVWDFEVKTNLRDKVNLSFEGIASVPSEFEVWLMDEALQITQNLRASVAYSVAGSEHPKALKLVVGKREFITQQLAEINHIPATYELSQNFPNPFNPVTTIRYGLPQAERMTLKIYSVLGEEVATLVNDEQKAAGYHVAIWDGRNKHGISVGSGVYVYRMLASNHIMTKKLLLVK